jgi:hypothetical protein
VEKMTDYIHQTGGVVDSVRHGRASLRHPKMSIIAKTTDAELKTVGFLPVVYVNEAYDDATQIRTGPAGCGIGDPVPPNADAVTGTYTVRDKTEEELAADQQAVDITDIKSSVDKIAFIVTEDISRRIKQGITVPTDFSPAVRQIFQDLKVIVDRAKP